jgi:hypothetical protein
MPRKKIDPKRITVFNMRTWRCSIPPNFHDFFSSLLSELEAVDPDEIRILAKRYAERFVETTDAHIDRIFDRPLNKKYSSRFSDGTYPVLYTAMACKTAFREFYYHFKLDVVDNIKESHATVLAFHPCRFTGNAVDLSRNDWPQLYSERPDYRFCWELAAEARDLRLHGLVSPSARHPNGLCVPIFERSSASPAGKRPPFKFSVSYGPDQPDPVLRWVR